MGVQSINEPQNSQIGLAFLNSINEPAVLPDTPVTEEPAPLEKKHEVQAADPDELEEQIEEAEDDDDFKPTHSHHARRPLAPKHRKK